MEAYTSEIRLLPYTFAPMDWLWCEGQILQVQLYQALYSLIGNTYGGTAPNTFALPDLRGRSVVAATQSNGTPPGLTSYSVGHVVGAPQVVAPLAAHNHQPNSGYISGTVPSDHPTATAVFNATAGNMDFAPQNAPNRLAMAAQSISSSVSAKLGNAQGAADPHPNVQPYLTLHFAICVNGYYPTYP